MPARPRRTGITSPPHALQSTRYPAESRKPEAGSRKREAGAGNVLAIRRVAVTPRVKTGEVDVSCPDRRAYSMNMDETQAPPGRLEARYRAFLETIASLRPKLHRYCARMTGSTLDGEDVVQEALFDAYRRLETYDDSRPIGPWLFRVAHHRC